MGILLLVILLFPLPAVAYIDPFTGSLLIQGLIAGGLAVTYFVKKKWKQLKKFFGNSSESEDLEDIIDEKK